MKHRKNFWTLTGLLVVVSLAHATEVDWHAFTGGGGISQNGAVTLAGAIGQSSPVLSPATGGDYTLLGGFWSAFPAHTEIAQPVLSIQPLGGSARLSWPIGVNDFNLEYTTNLASGIWLPENTQVVDMLTEHAVTVESGTGARFFRLHHK
jgi:hypothetical protein